MAPRYFDKWGKHYLRSYLRAQELQLCMNFKDPGLQIYGGCMFHTLQDEGDRIFCDLPALEPTGSVPYTYTQSRQNTTTTGWALSSSPAGDMTDMSVFHNPSGGCFAPTSEVLMADKSRKPIRLIVPGEEVWTIDGPATVEYVLTIGSYKRAQLMCQVGKLSITPWHPIYLTETEQWAFPSSIYPTTDRIMPIVYNLVLSSGHIIDVEGVLTCTLGHGLTGGIIEHDFFGSKQKVLNALCNLDGYKDRRPVFYNLKAVRDAESGLIINWIDDV